MLRILRTAVVLLTVAASTVGLAQGKQQRRFYPDDPIWQEPVTQDVKNAVRYEPDLAYQTLENLFFTPGDPVLGQRAKNINTVDEVPDGPYFVNRATRMTLTPAIVARAANIDEGPAPGKWTVVSAKSDGVTPGFTIRDSRNTLWFIKFDPPGWRTMATGSEVVAAKLFWAAGYHTAEYHIGALEPANLVIGKDTRITPPGEMPRPMNQGDIDWLLQRAVRDSDGTYRVILSKAAPGRPVGRIRFHGTRADDPNDVIPHEHRRELRGYFVFAAWLNHVDAKGINSLSTLITENGRSFIRHYLLDFGSALGSAAVGPREGWEGYEALVEEPGEIGRRVLSLGFKVPVWRTQDYFESPSIGRLPRDHSKWDPETWWPHITNAAFRHMRPDDTFWAAMKVAAISEDMIRAAVAEGRFNDFESERFLARAIIDRRLRILQTFLPKVNPIVDPALDAKGRLTFRNAAVDAAVADRAPGYRALWYTFDNAADTATLVATTEETQSPMLMPAMPAAEYIKVDIAAVGGPEPWKRPVSAYFRRSSGNWILVGFERQP
ncbi:MAG TPA: hypothetical protein VJ691_01265 [Vicinamibacterales bacterium]|nr:hypothetical protein [Vicinamibacterales bacterium]